LNGQWTSSLRFTKTYDEKKDNLSYLREKWSNGKWMNIELDSCRYDAMGNKLSTLMMEWANEQWKDSTLEISTYNAIGKILSDSNYTRLNGQWTIANQFNYRYDANGNCLSKWSQGLYATYITADKDWNTIIDSCSYDVNGKVLNRTVISCGKDFYHCTYSSSSTYDVKGNLIVFSNVWSFIGGNWVLYPTDFYINAGNYPYYFENGLINWNIKISYRQMIITDVPTIPGSTTSDYSLSQNYPNPFTTSTTIKYKVTDPGFISLKVFNSMGTEVASLVNEQKSTGEYSVEWNASGFGSGIYFCKLKKMNYSETKKMILLK